MYHPLLLTLALAVALPCGSARAAGEADCPGEPFRFALYDARGRLYNSVEAVTGAPVVLAYYQGYKSANVMDNLRAALAADPVVGTNTKLGELWAGFPIIDYREAWFVPGWIMDKVLRDKMAKYPKTVFLLDKGECLTKNGTSPKCPAHTRVPYFTSNRGSVAVIYKGYLFKKFSGPTSAGPFVQLIRALTAQAAQGASYCQARRAVGE
jgi:hypothetical protein